MPFMKIRGLLYAKSQLLHWLPPPHVGGDLDDLEKQLGADPMRHQVVNIMQHSAKSFLIHLANADQVEAFMAQGLTFRGHLLVM